MSIQSPFVHIVESCVSTNLITFRTIGASEEVVENKCLSISQRIVILVLFPNARFVTVIMIFARSSITFIHSTRTASSFKAKHANYIEIMQVNKLRVSLISISKIVMKE